MVPQKIIIGYARKSTDEKDKQIMSIPDQIEDINKFYDSLSSTDKGYPLKIMEETKSAYRPNNRPIFNLNNLGV